MFWIAAAMAAEALSSYMSAHAQGEASEEQKQQAELAGAVKQTDLTQKAINMTQNFEDVQGSQEAMLGANEMNVGGGVFGPMQRSFQGYMSDMRANALQQTLAKLNVESQEGAANQEASNAGWAAALNFGIHAFNTFHGGYNSPSATSGNGAFQSPSSYSENWIPYRNTNAYSNAFSND